MPFSSKNPPSFPQLPQRDCGKLNFSKIHHFAQNFQEKPQSAPILFLKKDFFTAFSFRRLGNFYPFLDSAPAMPSGARRPRGARLFCRPARAFFRRRRAPALGTGRALPRAFPARGRGAPGIRDRFRSGPLGGKGAEPPAPGRRFRGDPLGEALFASAFLPLFRAHTLFSYPAGLYRYSTYRLKP